MSRTQKSSNITECRLFPHRTVKTTTFRFSSLHFRSGLFTRLMYAAVSCSQVWGKLNDLLCRKHMKGSPNFQARQEIAIYVFKRWKIEIRKVPLWRSSGFRFKSSICVQVTSIRDERRRVGEKLRPFLKIKCFIARTF